MTLGERIKTRRLQLGYSQTELAFLAGMRPAQVSRYEMDANQPSSEMIVALAKALRVSTDWLLGVTDAGIEIDGLNEIERQALEILRSKTPDRQPAILEVMRLF